MQIVSLGDNLHESQTLLSGKNKKRIINLLSAELAQRKIKVKEKPGVFSKMQFSN